MAAMTTSVLMGDTRLAGQNGAQEFGDFYASHYRYVLRVCRRFLWRREDAEDAASEVFLKLRALENEGGVSGKISIKPVGWWGVFSVSREGSTEK